LESSIFWNITQCNVNVNGRFGRTYHCFLLGLLFDLEDGGDMFLRNVG
jgi:hypothetical protein